jgi:S-formylglutathione hydrolase FrmB
MAIADLPDSPLKTLLNANRDWFAAASSYPDRWRNRKDFAENPRHFLDSENFGFGNDLTKIPRPFGDVVKLRTYKQLRNDGMNPWTVSREYALLVIALREKRMDDALMHAAYVSHYVADAHVPFHASANYDGQLSDPPQKGIHARFESTLLEKTITESDLKTGKPTPVADPTDFDFSVLQDSMSKVKDILAADKDAVTASGGEYNDAYWKAFADKARPIAIDRLESSGRDIAGILEKAWEEAGKPKLDTKFVASNRLLPYAPEFVEHGQPEPAFLPAFTDTDKASARAKVTTIQVKSEAMGRDIPVNIILPEDYATSGKRYSVLYLLHGMTHNYSDWNNKSGVAAYAAKRPFIIVMPDGGQYGWYSNTPKQGKYGDFFEKELVPAIDKAYRTISKREGRAIAGLSMGGYGAWRIGLDLPDTFCAAASLSGALLWGEGPTDNVFLSGIFTQVYGQTPTVDDYHKESLLPRIDKLGSDTKWSGPALYFDVGTEDPLVFTSNETMEQYLLSHRIPYEYAEYTGKHEWPYWDQHVLDVLQFIERHIARPQ